jgi:hypothetical protein
VSSAGGFAASLRAPLGAKNVQKKCRPPLASLAPGGERRAAGAPMLCLVACRDHNQNILNNM